MSAEQFGRILHGSPEALQASWEAFMAQGVDQVLRAESTHTPAPRHRTIAKAVSVSGPGTFLGKAQRTLTFAPTDRFGWWFERTDQPDELPIRVAPQNVWTTQRNIVLRSGSPHNYMRMVEHIIALRLGMDLDHLVIKMDSGDPPLFDRCSMDLVETLDSAGVVDLETPARFCTVREPVSMMGPYGSFLVVHPAEPGAPRLDIDCAIDFKTAIGQQRIQFDLNDASFRRGAEARTNTTFARMLFTRTAGKLLADVRNLGYTNSNILIAGRHGYHNDPHLVFDGKSLEACWHRAVMDLVAALALVDVGRFVGTVYSYKAGHTLDCQFVKKLYINDLIVPL